ncbi:hypothetical protein KCTC52924_00677 [Arenibacter antarcticus]|uniref:Porin family protein n=1 Tax=Arenibacter antarcticus TaxID=2040469 RepID=A0ABW5VBU6_9FLAO|nr:porin family protein [Arenibacter sp. H213]MCM4169259.1 hypothetical protein [Arenibacter sp. H213]
MRGLLQVLFCFISLGVVGQDIVIFDVQDRKYLEDQFYLGLTYNFLMELPIDVEQRNLSYGLQGGFIKDIPLNWDRTLGLGIGLGYGINSYYTNLRAVEQLTGVEYEILDRTTSYKRNKIETHVLEMPLQMRWRNSTPEEYKFWRVYAGMKLGYVFGNRSKFVSSTEKVGFSNPDINRFQYGLAFNVGYNTFNIHVYYSLRSLFKENASLPTGIPLNLQPLQIGLIFYIL